MNAARNKSVKKLKSLCYVTLGGAVAYQFIYMKKDFNGYYESVLQPISQFLNPELAHTIGVAAFKYGLFPSQNSSDPDILRTKFLNNELGNPIGIAAGFDKHGDAVLGLKNVGFGLVEIGSVTPLPQPGNPKPRVFRLPDDKAVINRYGFNSEGHDNVYNKIKDLDKTLMNNALLGINLGMNKLSEDPVNDYCLGVKKFWNVADYFVINVSSPNTPGLRSLQAKDELLKLLTEVNNVRNEIDSKKSIPLLLKLAPDLSPQDKKDISDVIIKKGSQVDGLIISNTTIERPQLVHQDVSKEAGGLSGKPLADKSTDMIKEMYKLTQGGQEAGGLSGKPLADKSTDMIKEMYKLTQGKVPIIGVGGIFTGQDAYEKILAGASVVQIYTALIYHGPPVVEKIKRELADLLKKDGYSNVNEAVGKGVK